MRAPSDDDDGAIDLSPGEKAAAIGVGLALLLAAVIVYGAIFIEVFG